MGRTTTLLDNTGTLTKFLNITRQKYEGLAMPTKINNKIKQINACDYGNFTIVSYILNRVSFSFQTNYPNGFSCLFDGKIASKTNKQLN